MVTVKNKLLRSLGRQRWLRFGVRDRIMRALHNPDTCKPQAFEVSFYGKKYNGDFSTFLDWSTYYFGAYCVEELELIKDSLKEGHHKIVVDIGANVGHHSLFASTIAESVHAFEPFPLVAQKIREKIAANKTENIFIHELALGSEDAEMPYLPPDDCNTGTGSFEHGTKNSPSTINLPVRIGDNYFEKAGINRIGFIKIDVEGFERFVFAGLKRAIKENRPVVFFEWSNSSIDAGVNILDNFPAGYAFFDFESDEIKWGLFAKPGYRLKAFRQFREGNKVAIPSERSHLFKRHYV